MADLLIYLVASLMGSTGRGANTSKLRVAYRSAWRNRKADSSLHALMTSMKTRNVFGIYTSPEQNSQIQPYFAAWTEGVPPTQLRAFVQQARRHRR